MEYIVRGCALRTRDKPFRGHKLEIRKDELSNCINIEEEVLNYQWRVDKEDKSLNIPIDAYNHALDAVRYKISDIENFKPITYSSVY